MAQTTWQIQGNINSAEPVFFGGDIYFYAGIYQISYVTGAARYSDTSGWIVGTTTTNTYNWTVVVEGSPGSIANCPVINPDLTDPSIPSGVFIGGYDTQALAQAANNSASPITFNHSGGQLGVKFNNTSYANIFSGSPNPTWQLNLVSYALPLPNEIEADFNFSFNITVPLTASFSFSWDTGNDILYYYRVQGECIAPTCVNTGLDPSDINCNSTNVIGATSGNTQSIQIVAAKSVAEVCSILQSTNGGGSAIWPIQSIKRYSRPVYTTDIAALEAQGIDQSCNILIDQPFCTLPECFQFCGGQTLVVSIGATVTIQEAFLTYSGSGTLYFSGGVSSPSYLFFGSGNLVFSGSATVIASHHSYVGSGGLVFSGHAGIVSSSFHYSASGGLLFSGAAGIASSIFHYNGSGGLVFSGTSPFTVNYYYTTDDPPTLISGSATYELLTKNYLYNGSGGLLFSGAAMVAFEYYSYNGSGGLIFSGVAGIISSAFNYNGSGGLNFSGSAYQVLNYENYNGSGGLVFSGSASISNNYAYNGSGGLIFGGHAGIVSTVYSYNGSGNLDFSGSANVLSSWLGSFLISIGSSIELPLFQAIYYDIQSSVPLPAPKNTILSSCGCQPLPLILYLSQNLINSNELTTFLNLNSFSIPDIVELRYSKLTTTWRNNYKFNGLGSEGTNETWNIIFEWGCASIVGGVIYDNPVWKFSVFINRNNPSEGYNLDTRILFAFGSITSCEQQALDLSFSFDTQNVDFSNISEEVESEILSFYDQAGIFNSLYWLSSPIALFEITENDSVISSTTFNISGAYPVVATISNS